MSEFYRRYVKRALDIVIAGGLLLALSPVLIVTAVLIKLTSPGPVFFTQRRLGYRTRTFTIYKFRSMQVAYVPDPNRQVYESDPAVTPVGKFIRRFKIDELPQLWNILIGDMTLIGPRPTLPEHLQDYTPEQIRRYDVVPGLTGWAQVNGNILLPIDQRIEHDLWYIAHLSPWLDLKILWMTASVVLRGEKIRKANQ